MISDRTIADWEARGSYRDLAGHRIFTLDVPAADEQAPPLLVLHGFPTCSFDFRHVLPALSRRRRVLLLDFLGYGLSAKPDQAYSLFEQADIAQAFVVELGLDAVELLTHDMGDTIGGELLAREMDGALPFAVTGRVICNGSIYIDEAGLRDGQKFLLALPDERFPDEFEPPPALFFEGLPPIFGPDTQPSSDELEAQWELLVRRDGHRLMPRLIRYIEQRREHETRWTGAIERHPSALRIVWGDADPVAVVTMARTLHERVPASTLVELPGIGHFPMIEAPDRFAREVVEGLS